MAKGGGERPIIIKRIEISGGGHHGGAWKVAYADFVTAMMAFFLLLWLLGSTTEDQRKSLADYFSPSPAVSSSNSGSGGLLGGVTISVPGSLSSPNAAFTAQESAPSTLVAPTENDGDSQGAGEGAEGEDSGSGQQAAGAPPKPGAPPSLTPEQREKRQFDRAAEELKKAIENSPDLQGLKNNLLVDQTPEGMRVQIVDAEGKSMFALGSTQMNEDMRKLLARVVQAIGPLPNKVAIRGHTDATPFANNPQGNWDLSSQRAGATLRALSAMGLNPGRIADVSGRAEVDPLFPENPNDPRNRRISIILFKQAQ
ncbi:OmpA family protein [Skermanella mucosa]|uniref:flagellar motor protein MotB n=1 Tax=Skermanella mucosa TaxID=1789672 RepID=UPI00192C6C25|nr:flagellar motor protein MotB [Skermanella mucosa]UEM21590.1 OmpA family protein [Skermanella mucosa]